MRRKSKIAILSIPLWFVMIFMLASMGDVYNDTVTLCAFIFFGLILNGYMRD